MKRRVLIYTLKVEVEPSSVDTEGMIAALKPFGEVILLTATMVTKS